MNSKATTIAVLSILGDDIRSRSCMDYINERIDSVQRSGETAITLDFTGVRHISRSFTDELCETVDHMIGVSIQVMGMEDAVRNMYDIVSESRRNKRVRTETPTDVQTFHDMESLSHFLATI